LRFLLFGPSMPAYMPTEPTTLLDVSRNGIRDAVEMGGGSEDGGELGGEVTRDEEQSEMAREEIAVVKERQVS